MLTLLLFFVIFYIQIITDRPLLHYSHLEEVPLESATYEKMKNEVTKKWEIYYQHPLIIKYHEEESFTEEISSF